ncbi:MAG: hypothetical protein C4297_02680 [Gemmataceae bacterium]
MTQPVWDENRLVSRRKQLAFWAVALSLFVIFAFVFVQYTLKAAEDRSAFIRWRGQVQDLIAGKDIYELYTYPNAPIMALILYPLTWLPTWHVLGIDLETGALTWFLLKTVMAAAGFVMTLRMVQGDRTAPAWQPATWALVLALSLRPIIGDLSHGNVNILIFFLTICGLLCYNYRWDFSGGLFLALAASCKVTPALFFVYFLYKRAWRLLAGALCGLMFFLFLIPGAVLGHNHNAALLLKWMDKMVLPYAAEGIVTTEHNNQSLPGLIYRMTTASPSFLDENDRPSAYHNLVDLDPRVARLFVLAAGILYLVLLYRCSRVDPARRPTGILGAEYAVVVLGMLLFSERTWKHHCVVLVLPYAVIAYVMMHGEMHRRLRMALIGCLIAALAVMSTTSTSVWEALGNRFYAKLAQVYGAYVWAELLLLGAIVTVLKKPWTWPGTAIEYYRSEQGQVEERAALLQEKCTWQKIPVQ